MKYFVLFFLTLSPLLGADISPLEKERSEQALETFHETNPLTTSDFTQELIHVMLALGVLIAILFVGAWFIRKLMYSKMIQVNKTSPIKILDQRAISTKSIIYIIEIYDRHLIVGESGGQLSALGEFPIEENEDFQSLMDKKS